jgi:phage shock protein A
MSILQRFKTIMESNIHAYLDNAENSERMINEYLRSIQLDLGKVKSETAAVITAEKRAKRALDECNADIRKMERYAKKSLESGSEENARKFLEKKAALVEISSKLQAGFELAASNKVQFKQMHDKLVADLNEIEARATIIKGKAAMAKSQENLNKMGSSYSRSNYSLSAFGQMEEKVDRRLEEAKAIAELNKDPFSDLEHPSAQIKKRMDVDIELTSLKDQIRKKE